MPQAWASLRGGGSVPEGLSPGGCSVPAWLMSRAGGPGDRGVIVGTGVPQVPTAQPGPHLLRRGGALAWRGSELLPPLPRLSAPTGRPKSPCARLREGCFALTPLHCVREVSSSLLISHYGNSECLESLCPSSAELSPPNAPLLPLREKPGAGGLAAQPRAPRCGAPSCLGSPVPALPSPHLASSH